MIEGESTRSSREVATMVTETIEDAALIRRGRAPRGDHYDPKETKILDGLVSTMIRRNPAVNMLTVIALLAVSIPDEVAVIIMIVKEVVDITMILQKVVMNRQKEGVITKLRIDMETTMTVALEKNQNEDENMSLQNHKQKDSGKTMVLVQVQLRRPLIF